MYEDETANNENNDQEHFQVQSTGYDRNYVLVNTRIDYQYRSDILDDMCLYDFVSTLYKKKMTEADLRYLSTNTASREREGNRRGRPANERFPFQAQHPQGKTYVLVKYSEPHVPILHGPQIPRQDRDETRERYCLALLTLFVPWRAVTDLCDINQTWNERMMLLNLARNRSLLTHGRSSRTFNCCMNAKKIVMNICSKLLLKLKLMVMQ